MEWASKTAAVVVAVSVAYILLKKSRGSSISDIRGPDSFSSFFLGHLKFLWHSECGVVESRFLRDYGAVVRIKGPFLENRLWIADPKALHHILQATSYLYVKPAIRREAASLLTDRGLLWAGGETHRRQRKGMMPAFGLTASRELLPRFVEVLDKLDNMWKDLIADASDETTTLDAIEWLGRAALDVIGKAAFEYDFGALERLDKPITETYINIINFAFGTKPPPVKMFIADVAKYFPLGVITWLFEKGKEPHQQISPGIAVALTVMDGFADAGSVRIHENRKQAHAVARILIDAKRKNMRNGDQGKDVLSLLINGSGEADGMLDDFELISQFRTLILAGHETTSKSMAYILWELAKNPESQTKLRTELDANVSAKGNADFTAVELETMPYLNAVIKETMRIHTSITDIIREASEDNVLPLSTPIVGTSGKTYRELYVPKGTIVHASTSGYNTNPDVWGSDARVFRPERWLEQDMSKMETPVGVYGNLLSFSAGSRSCIGWRFAIIELQAFIARLVREFQFSEVEGKPITMWRPGLVVPTVEGEEDKGPQLPLKVSAIRGD